MREEFVLDRFLGLNRNVASKAGEEPIMPDDVFNLWPVSQGGLQKFGGAVQTSTIAETLIGFDESGLVSFRDVGNTFRLWSKDTSVIGTSTGATVSALHVPLVGVQENYETVLYQGRDVTIDTEAQLALGYSVGYSPTGGDLRHATSTLWIVDVLVYRLLKNGMRHVVDKGGGSVLVGGVTSSATISVTIPPVGTGSIADIFLTEDRQDGTFDKLSRLAVHDGGDPTATSTATISKNPEDTTLMTPSGTARGMFASWVTTLALHNRRYWGPLKTGTANRTRFSPDFGLPDMDTPDEISTPLTLGYTIREYINFFDAVWALNIPSVASESITHVLSSSSNAFGEFGGLVVFCEDETWVVVGDPDVAGSLGVERFPVTIGADAAVRPVAIGDVIFAVWNGDLYTIAGAQVEKISQPLLESDENITKLAADPDNRCIVVKLDTGILYRYFYEFNFWMRDVQPAIWGTESVIPSDLFSGTAGSYYYFTAAGTSQVAAGDIWVVDRTTNDGGTPSISYRDIDFGDAARYDTWLDLRAYTDDWPTVTATSADAPRLYYSIVGTETDVDTDAANTDFVLARQTGDQMYYTLPYLRRGREMDFRLRMDGMDLSATLHPPMQVGFVQGYRYRR